MLSIEEDLKQVLKYLPKGTLLEKESFMRAVRYKQHFEDIYGCSEPIRNKGFEKFETGKSSKNSLEFGIFQV